MANEIKTVQVSTDDVTYYTLPGSTAEISVESASVDNSIYGQAYASSLAGVFSYSFSANAWLRQTPGFNVEVKSAGSPTAFTDEPMSLVSGNTYQIADATKNYWDYTETVVVLDGGVAVDAANIESIDYLFGIVTFVSTYTPTGAITATGTYLVTTAFGCANSVDLSLSADQQDSSCFETVAANGGYTTSEYGRKTVGMELSGLYRTANDFFSILEARQEILVEIDFDGNGTTVARGVMRVVSYSQSGDAGAQEEYSASLELSAPEDVEPFSFYFGATSLAPAGFKVIMNSWLAREKMYFRYYPRGEDNEGYKGKIVITDASLSASVDSIVEMSVDGSNDGALTELI